MDRSYLAQLAVLAAVADRGSFRGAARDLAIAPSAVSHAVSSLEARLGVRLLARSTRSVAPTEEGARLLERLRPALSEIDLALEAAVEARDRPAGNLRLTVPRTALNLVLAPKLGAFAKAYPEIVLDIVIEDRFADVVEGGVRLGESLQQDMVAVRIGPQIRSAVVGAPSYFARMPKPKHPRDLVGHRCIRFRFSSGVLYRWEFEKDGEEIELPVQGPLILGVDSAIIRAAIDGAGLAFVFEEYAQQALATGSLIRVLEDWCPPFDGFYVYYPSRRQMRPALRAFVDFFRWRDRDD